MLAWSLVGFSWELVAYEVPVTADSLPGYAIVILLIAIHSMWGVIIAAYIGVFLVTPLLMVINPRGVFRILFRITESLLLWPIVTFVIAVVQHDASRNLLVVDYPLRYVWIATTLTWIATIILPPRQTPLIVTEIANGQTLRAFPTLPINSLAENPPAPPATSDALP